MTRKNGAFFGFLSVFHKSGDKEKVRLPNYRNCQKQKRLLDKRARRRYNKERCESTFYRFLRA